MNKSIKSLLITFILLMILLWALKNNKISIASNFYNIIQSYNCYTIESSLNYFTLDMKIDGFSLDKINEQISWGSFIASDDYNNFLVSFKNKEFGTKFIDFITETYPDGLPRPQTGYGFKLVFEGDTITCKSYKLEA